MCFSGTGLLGLSGTTGWFYCAVAHKGQKNDNELT